MIFPQTFIDRMNEYFAVAGHVTGEGFFESFDKEPYKGIRINKLKTDSEYYSKVISSLGLSGKMVPWCDCGVYADEDFQANGKTGKDPYYHAGVYYPTEPSAMLPANVLGAKPGDVVLDLCAAPGGKACRIGEELKGEGLLVANEISEQRSKALLRNIERTGIRNVVILNETPEKLASKLEGFFDKVLVDAPCSGEGMFRRDPAAIKSWERYGPEPCQTMQKEILESADTLLKVGGELVYSTCTFCEGEDELMIIDFMNNHPGYEVVCHPEVMGVTHLTEADGLPGAMRIWPHLSEGDGHFCVHLRKVSSVKPASNEDKYLRKLGRRTNHFTYNQSREAFFVFMKEILTPQAYVSYEAYANRTYVLHGDKIHLMPVDERLFDKLKVVKGGDFPGEIKNTNNGKIFIPSHCLALTLKQNEINESSFLSIERNDDRVIRYLKGETIYADQVEQEKLKSKGTIVISVDGYPLGFGKISSDGSIKNMYPKAWRLM